MLEIELSSLLLEYDGELYEIVYSDDHPDFIYTPSVPPIFILFPHQLFPQVIQEQPPEDLFETESDTEVLSLEHLQIWLSPVWDLQVFLSFRLYQFLQ